MIRKSLRQSILTYVRRGIQYASGLFPQLKIPLTSSIVPTIGAATPTFSRDTTATVTDFEGVVHTAQIDELRFPGARRVENLLSDSEVLSTQTVTVISGASYILSFTGSGTVTLSGAATGTLVGSAGRVEVIKTASTTSLTLTVSGSVLQAQLERKLGTQTMSSEYVSTGVLSWPYHGAGVDGVKYFRTDRDGVFLSDLPGVLVEPEGMNLIPYSEDFTNWTLRGTIPPEVTADYVVSPDGQPTADRIVFGPDANSRIDKTIYTAVPGNTLTFSVWLKSEEESESIQIGTYTLNSLYRAITITNVWERYTVTREVEPSATIFLPVIRNYTDAVEKVIYAWGAQVEVGEAATSYIQTNGTPTTRTADNLFYDVYSAITQGQGSLYCEFVLYQSNDSSFVFSLSNGTSVNRIILYQDPNDELLKYAVLSGSSYIAYGSSSVVYEDLNKAIITYQDNDIKFVLNGEVIDIDMSGVIPSDLTQLNVDGGFKTIRDFKYYDKPLTEVQAIRITS